MTSQVTGVVGYKGYNDWKGKKLWSIGIDKEYYRFGTNEPQCEKGDEVSFSFDSQVNGKYVNNDVILDTFNVVAKATAEVSASKAAKGAGKRTPRKVGAKDDYWEQKAIDDKQRQVIISYQAATNTAAAVVSKAIELDLLSMPKTKGKGFDAFVEAIDKTAKQYFQKYQNANDVLVHSDEAVENSTDVEEAEAEGDVSDD